MLEINKLSDIYGNRTVTRVIETLINKRQYPKLSIMAGMMGVGKSSAARVVASMLDSSGQPTKVFNFSMPVDMQKIQEEVFALKPLNPRAFIFEEIHGLSRDDQSALLQMFDSQSSNVYIICTTTEIHDVLKTICSRAQVFTFRSLSEKQLEALLENYTSSKGVKLDKNVTSSLLRTARGVPRDLIKNTDLVISAELSADDLNSLLCNVSDTTAYILMCSMMSNTTDFLRESYHKVQDTPDLLYALRDFWIRYMLERTTVGAQTIPKEIITALDAMYTDEHRMRLSKMLLKATPQTLMLEMMTMNMSLTGTTASAALGTQVDQSQAEERVRRKAINNARPMDITKNPQVTADYLNKFKI